MPEDLNPTAMSVGRAQERVRAAAVHMDEIADEIRSLTVVEEPTDDQEARLDELMAAYEPAKDEHEKLELRFKRLQEAASIPANITSGDGARRDVGPTLYSKSNRDPYDLSELRSVAMNDGPKAVGQELRSRAHDAIERAPEGVKDEHRESAARLVDTQGRSRNDDGSGMVEYGPTFARYMLEHGSPSYTDAFYQYLRGGMDNLSQEERASLSTTGANGGFMIPFFLDPSIILTNAGAVNPFRAIARVETIPTNVWHGVSSAGVTAEWTSEASEFTDASPAFLQPTVTPIRADAYVQASWELIQDSNVEASIGMLFADAKNRLEATAFATGTGSTQPEGIVTRLSVTTASKVAAQTNASLGAIDVFALVNNLPARYQDKCVWLGHWFTYNIIRQAGGPQTPNFWVDLGPGIPSQLLGRSTYQSSAMLNASGAVGLSSATSSNDNVLILGDFSEGFLIVDRIGMEVVFDNLVKGANFRPSGQVGWSAFWRVGSDTVNSDAFRMLVV